MFRILGWKGANTRIYGLYYKAMAQSVLTYGLERWVLMTQVVRTVWDLHHKVDRQLTQ